MTRALVITQDSDVRAALREGMLPYDIGMSFTASNNGVNEAVASTRPDVLLVEIGAGDSGQGPWALARKLKKQKGLPVIALVPRDRMDGLGGTIEADDFLVSPYHPAELALRIIRLTEQVAGPDTGREKIKCEGLVIDPDTCEVTVDGEVVELTFKEYELLKLLAGSPGRVYTRDALLDKIWGYDYYGGDRTVDVHIRRLRSKIEESGHTFIETVRNIGYRFRSGG